MTSRAEPMRARRARRPVSVGKRENSDRYWEYHFIGISLKIKRAEIVFYATLKRIAWSLWHLDLPFWRPWGTFPRAIYVFTNLIVGGFRGLIAVMYYGSIFESYRASFGRDWKSHKYLE